MIFPVDESFKSLVEPMNIAMVFHLHSAITAPGSDI